jgi:hypothetical protein
MHSSEILTGWHAWQVLIVVQGCSDVGSETLEAYKRSRVMWMSVVVRNRSAPSESFQTLVRHGSDRMVRLRSASCTRSAPDMYVETTRREKERRTHLVLIPHPPSRAWHGLRLVRVVPTLRRVGRRGEPGRQAHGQAPAAVGSCDPILHQQPTPSRPHLLAAALDRSLE